MSWASGEGSSWVKREREREKSEIEMRGTSCASSSRPRRSAPIYKLSLSSGSRNPLWPRSRPESSLLSALGILLWIVIYPGPGVAMSTARAPRKIEIAGRIYPVRLRHALILAHHGRPTAMPSDLRLRTRFHGNPEPGSLAPAEPGPRRPASSQDGLPACPCAGDI